MRNSRYRGIMFAICTLAVFAGAAFLFFERVRVEIRAAACAYGAADTSECMMRIVRDELAQHGPEDAMAVFDTLAARHSTGFARSAGACHILSHEVGELAYGFLGVDEALSAHGPLSSLRSCDYGYYHAYLEALFEDRPDPLLASSLCTSLGEGLDDAPAVRDVCFQSAGSGFVRSELSAGKPAFDEASTRLRNPLRKCEQVSGADEELRSCRIGVFGEFVFRALEARPYELVRVPELSAICAGFSRAELVECRRQVSAALFLTPDFSMKSLSAHVRFFRDDAVREAVFTSGLKLFFTDERLATSTAQILRDCAVHAPEISWCVPGMVKGIMSVRTDANPVLRALPFCASESVIERGSESACYAAISDSMEKLYIPERVGSLCARFPLQYRYLCVPK